jgi:protein TonB
MPSRDTAAGPAADRLRPRHLRGHSPRDYRKDAATHLYSHNQQRIYKGKLPPMLYAIGVLEVDIDRRAASARLHWMRAPRHAPEVVAEIERTVRAAAPYPVPAAWAR